MLLSDVALSSLDAHMVSALAGDSLWTGYLTRAPRVHLAVLVEPYLSYILEGRKTIESRFGKTRAAPYAQVGADDVVLLKRAAGPIVGAIVVSRAEHLQLDPCTWPIVKRYSPQICADELFWQQRSTKHYATLLHVGAVRRVSPIGVAKADRRAWVVLKSDQQRLLESCA